MTKVRSDIGQFGMIPLWLLAEPRLGHVAIRLFCVMAAKYADRQTGECFPSRKQLAADVGVSSTDTIDRALKELADAGAVISTPRSTSSGDRDTSLYTLFFVAPSRTSRVTGGRTDAATVAAPVVQDHYPESIEPESSKPEAATAAVFAAVENLQGSLTSFVTDAVNAELDDGVNPEWIIAACDEAALANVRRWKYVAAILNNWRQNGFRSENGRPKAGGRNGRDNEGADRKKQADTRARGGKW